MSDALIPFEEYKAQRRREAEERARKSAEEAAKNPRKWEIPPTVEAPSGLACPKCGEELTEVIPGVSGSLMLFEAWYRCDHCKQFHDRGPQTGKNGPKITSFDWFLASVN